MLKTAANGHANDKSNTWIGKMGTIPSRILAVLPCFLRNQTPKHVSPSKQWINKLLLVRWSTQSVSSPAAGDQTEAEQRKAWLGFNRTLLVMSTQVSTEACLCTRNKAPHLHGILGFKVLNQMLTKG